MSFSLRSGLQRTASLKKLPNFGKAWAVGDSVAVLYRIAPSKNNDPLDLCVSQIYGHNIDAKALNTKFVFYPSHAEIDPETSQVITPDFAIRMSRVAALYLEAAYQSEKKAVLEKQFGAGNDAIKAQALQQIEEKYKGQGSKLRPVIGSLQSILATECLVIKLKDGNPINIDDTNARMVTRARLSEKRARALLDILVNPDFCNYDEDEGFLEVRYNFTASNNEKATAGQAAPIGVPVSSHLLKRYPKGSHEGDVIRSLADTLAVDEVVMRNHNYDFQPVSELSLRTACNSYFIIGASNCSNLEDADKEQLIAYADELSAMRIQFDDPKLNAAIQAKLAAPETQETPVSDVPTLESITAMSDSDFESMGDFNMDLN